MCWLLFDHYCWNEQKCQSPRCSIMNARLVQKKGLSLFEPHFQVKLFSKQGSVAQRTRQIIVQPAGTIERQSLRKPSRASQNVGIRKHLTDLVHNMGPAISIQMLHHWPASPAPLTEQHAFISQPLRACPAAACRCPCRSMTHESCDMTYAMT